ncbi:TPA: hypothetical protein PPN70_001605 [Serratia rubidaea]|uniref:WapI family immunity protein n=1 Tax=Serratia rubidaea TaxID=61652 RepID=UPI0023AF0132|nr:hypothetical protein [Serratia rubidaea]MCR0998136.1 hypothetical protein [Serratia rubidaea]MDK1703127.1 hypothetical protein [Serratia rubidaea]HDJ1439189.1 hypothetical protein [Serratia rubidaea]HDJ1449945.1 hypothetical protein [Serratia rubidaea]HDJ1461989.1 hypothetical protein [Serratia rubidaea]
MINITVEKLSLQLSPYERESEPDNDSYIWIKTFIEYKLPGLAVQYSTAFTVWELRTFRERLALLYAHLVIQEPHTEVVFDSLENHFNLHIAQVGHNDIVEVNIAMRPEDHADSAKVTDTFYLDQSYFPALLSGLDKMINWQN